VKVGWPAARAVGRGCAAGALDFYYYSIPGGCGGLYGRPPCAAGFEPAAALGAGCVGSSSKECDTAPLLQELARSLARCPRPTAGVRARRRLHLPISYSTTVRPMFRCPGPSLGSALWSVSPIPT
jgi:hypothetical protein